MEGQTVVYVPEFRVFVIAPEGGEPFALSAVSPHMPASDELLLWCRTTGWFFSPFHGEQFDLNGYYEIGPAATGMQRVPLQVVDGTVEVMADRLMPGRPRDEASRLARDPRPNGPFCLSDAGYVEVAPGIAEPPNSETPPIVVNAPRSGEEVTSPVGVVGNADVFEAKISIQILDAEGNVLAETFTTASCGTGCRGIYSAEVAFSVVEPQPA